MEKIYIGMDLHKSTSSFCVMDKEGSILREQRIPTTVTEVTKFIKSFGNGLNISLALEPVSQWYVFADLLEELGVDVHLAHPRKLKAIATSFSKTDKLDSRIIADHLRTNHLPEAYHSPKEVRCWKEIVRSRSALVKLRTETKNRVHAVLFKNGLTSPITSLFTKRGFAWLKSLEIEEHFRLSIQKYISVINHLSLEIKEMEKTIQAKVMETKEMKILKSIPGIGNILSATIMAEIGEIKRFKDPKQLQSYAGIVPWVHNSGESKWNGRITKIGSSWLRFAVIEAVVGMARTRTSSDLKDYFLRIKKAKNYQTATVATARKLLAIIWSVLKNERMFEARYLAI
ncbi:MAG: IS110 family transposase [bacterium]|nr:IS110 family transposase [bacterium]